MKGRPWVRGSERSGPPREQRTATRNHARLVFQPRIELDTDLMGRDPQIVSSSWAKALDHASAVVIYDDDGELVDDWDRGFGSPSIDARRWAEANVDPDLMRQLTAGLDAVADRYRQLPLWQRLRIALRPPR